jgi:hypothetical protein
MAFVLKDSQETDNDYWYVGQGAATKYRGGSFIAGSSYLLAKVALKLRREYSPNNLMTLLLYSDSGGDASSLLATSTNTVNMSTLSNIAADWTAEWLFNNYSLVSGTKYHFEILSASVDGSSYATIRVNNAVAGQSVELDADGVAPFTVSDSSAQINFRTYAEDAILPSYPTKTIVVGGQGDRSGASDDNGGAYSSDIDYTSFQGVNGGPLYAVAGCAYDTATGKITKSASFATGLEGCWVNTREGAAGAWVEKRYYIQASDADSITIGAGLGSNADIDVWVGGALKTIEEALTEAAEASGSFDSGYDAGYDIHYGATTIRIDYPDGSLELSNGDSVTLDVPAGSGGAGSLINGGLINAI